MELSELIELVAENPDVIDPYLVYADFLQEHGDPRGELISLELMRLEAPHDESRVRAVAKHLDRHRHQLLGPLVELTACLSDDKWHLGFLKRITLQHPDDAPPIEVARWLQLMLEAPACAFLRDLTVTPLLRGDYAPVIWSLVTHGQSLRALRLGPGHEQSTRVDLTGISQGLAQLESLAIAATRIEMSIVRMPKLEQLDLWLNELTPDHLHALLVSELPSLRALSIAFSRGRIDAFPRFALAPMPKLEHLRVDARQTPELAGFVAELSRSDLSRQLTELSIDGVGLDDIERLVDSAAAFESLKRLSIVSRADVDDLLDRFRDRGVEVGYRHSFFHFDPWEEETDVQHDTLDLDQCYLEFEDWDDGTEDLMDDETGTVFIDYLR